MVVAALGLASMLAGCATQKASPSDGSSFQITADNRLIYDTNAPAGVAYNLKIYVVTRGDTLKIIATKFNTSIDNLCLLNPDMNPKRLRVWQKILVQAEPAK